MVNDALEGEKKKRDKRFDSTKNEGDNERRGQKHSFIQSGCMECRYVKVCLFSFVDVFFYTPLKCTIDRSV